MPIANRQTHRPTNRRPLALLTVPLTLAVLLAACAGRGPSAPDDPAQREFLSRAYAPGEPASVLTLAPTWQVSGHAVNLRLSEPQAGGALPLVIYLPGLGESSEAGEHWRTAWSAAGYAVLACQPLADDASAWNSDLALEANFKALGQRHFSDDAMARRLAVLSAVLNEAQRRTGDPAWQRIDWSRVAVAGFDLGAYTAMALAGERVAGADADGGTAAPPTSAAGMALGRLQLRAAIALSPFAQPAASRAGDAPAAADARYRGIRVPVLSITGDADADVLGLVPDPALRRVPFDHTASAGSLLLSLQGMHHANLGGNPAPARKRAASVTPATDSQAESGEQGGGQGGGQGSGQGTGQRSRGGNRKGGATPGAKPSRSTGGSGWEDELDALPPNALHVRLVAAESISIAFLDAQLKVDARAGAWLATAPVWLAPVGELRSK